MAEEPRGSAVLEDFPGMVEDIDPDDLPPGAAEIQINATCVRTGQLIVRLGILPVKFDEV